MSILTVEQANNVISVLISCTLIYCVVFIAVLIDLYSGIRRSRRLGIRVKSKGIRSTIRKYVDYCLLISLFTLTDFMLSWFLLYGIVGLHNIPWLSIISGIVVIGAEIFSVWENTDKNRQKDISASISGLTELARNRGEAEEILKLLEQRLSDKVGESNKQ